MESVSSQDEMRPPVLSSAWSYARGFESEASLLQCIALLSPCYGVIGSVEQLPYGELTLQSQWLLKGECITALRVEDHAIAVNMASGVRGHRECLGIRIFSPAEAVSTWQSVRRGDRIDEEAAARLERFFLAPPTTVLGRRLSVIFPNDEEWQCTVASILFTSNVVEIMPRERRPDVRSFQYWYGDPDVCVATHPGGGEVVVTVTGLR